MKEQLKNRNLLNPTGFKFIINTLPQVDFYCQEAPVPGVNTAVPNAPNIFVDLDVPPNKMTFDDLNITFLVDEDLVNYASILNWIKGMCKPESFRQSREFLNSGPMQKAGELYLNEYSNANLYILTNNYTYNIRVEFDHIFPTRLSGLQFKSTETDINYITADATFRYTNYRLYDKDGNRMTV